MSSTEAVYHKDKEIWLPEKRVPCMVREIKIYVELTSTKIDLSFQSPVTDGRRLVAVRHAELVGAAGQAGHLVTDHGIGAVLLRTVVLEAVRRREALGRVTGGKAAGVQEGVVHPGGRHYAVVVVVPDVSIGTGEAGREIEVFGVQSVV